MRNAKAAIEEGLLPGGGVALVQAAAKAEKDEAVTSLTGEEATGAAIVFRAIEAPIKQIAENSGVSGDVVFSKVRELPDGQGFNAATDEYEDLMAAGVTDPVKVTRSAERRLHCRPVPHHRSRCGQQAGTAGSRSGSGRRHGLLIQPLGHNTQHMDRGQAA